MKTLEQITKIFEQMHHSNNSLHFKITNKINKNKFNLTSSLIS